MFKPDPIYTTVNSHLAYQLNWSLSLFANAALPEKHLWLGPLRQDTEADGVRILDSREVKPGVIQFFVSTQPLVSPGKIVRSVKARLQYLIRDKLPRAFRRNYRIESVGEVNNKVLQDYVGRQTERHSMADANLQELFAMLQIYNPDVNLQQIRYSSHGQFLYNLHVVLENADHLHEVHEATLQASSKMIVRACAKKKFLLSRVGMVSNHLHILLGCDVSDAPLDVGLGFLNNLAYAHGMKATFEFGFYVGTFGNYDRSAIRRMLP